MVDPGGVTVTTPQNSATVCGNASVTVTLDNHGVYLFSDSYVTTAVCWEYELNGSNTWKHLDTSSNVNSLSFNPEDKMPEVKTGIQNVRFRARVRARYASAGLVWYTAYGSYSTTYNVMPSGPSVLHDLVKVTPSCFGQSTGRITVAGSDITGALFGNMRWLVRPGT